MSSMFSDLTPFTILSSCRLELHQSDSWFSQALWLNSPNFRHSHTLKSHSTLSSTTPFSQGVSSNHHGLLRFSSSGATCDLAASCTIIQRLWFIHNMFPHSYGLISTCFECLTAHIFFSMQGCVEADLRVSEDTQSAAFTHIRNESYEGR